MSEFFFCSRNPVAVLLRIVSLPVTLPFIVIGQLMTEALNPQPQEAGTLGQAIGAYIHGQGDDQ